MANIKDTDVIRKYRYRVASILIQLPDETITIPNEKLVSLQMTDDYENNMFPIFKLKIGLLGDQYYAINDNKNDVSIHLRIDKYYIELNDQQKESVAKNWIDDDFDLITDEDNLDLDISMDELEASSDYESYAGTDTEDSLDDDSVYTFYLFKSSLIDGTKKMINKVFTNCTVTDVYAYLFKKAGIKKVLMAPPDNTTVYKELFIPKMSIMSAFKFVDTYYGLYSSGAYIYIGISRAYVIPFSGRCNAWSKNEIKETSLIVPKVSDTKNSSNVGSVYKPDETKKSYYIIVDNKAIEVQNASITNDYIGSNDIEAVDPWFGKNMGTKSKAKSKKNKKETKKTTTKKVKKTTKSKKGKDGNTVKVKIKPTKKQIKEEEADRKKFSKQVVNHTENDLLPIMWVARSNSMSTVISLMTRDEDISAIKINKQYNILFDEPTYTQDFAGRYAIISVDHVFEKDGEHDLMLNTNLILAKTTEDYGTDDRKNKKNTAKKNKEKKKKKKESKKKKKKKTQTKTDYEKIGKLNREAQLKARYQNTWEMKMIEIPEMIGRWDIGNITNNEMIAYAIDTTRTLRSLLTAGVITATDANNYINALDAARKVAEQKEKEDMPDIGETDPDNPEGGGGLTPTNLQ